MGVHGYFCRERPEREQQVLIQELLEGLFHGVRPLPYLTHLREEHGLMHPGL